MKEICIRDFSVQRGSFVLKPLSLQIQKGEIFAVLGRTGSGKTVLLEGIGGMFSRYQGSIAFDGTEVGAIPPGRRGLGFVYQDHGLFPHMTVYDNIAYGLKMHRFSKEAVKRKTEELMEMLSITHLRAQYPGTLSGGESQRTALARALALEPEVLLLDEPFSALDPATRQQMYREIQAIHRRFRCTIIFVTHDFKEAELLAGRVGILLDGEMKAVVPAKDLMSGRYCREVEEFLGRKYENRMDIAGKGAEAGGVFC